MGGSADDSRKRVMKFLLQERRDIGKPSSSKFVRSSDPYAGSKWRMKGASETSTGSQPSSASIFSELTGLPMDLALPPDPQPEVGRIKGSQTLSETNIGFKLLKKSGWKEGSGLGVSEQGRLNPIQAQHKLDRRGIGAERKFTKRSDGIVHREPSSEDERETKKIKQEKNMSKKALNKEAEEERMREAAFAREFYREFWPEND